MNRRQRARRHQRRTYRTPKPVDFDDFWGRLMEAALDATRVPSGYDLALLHDSVMFTHLGDFVDLRVPGTRRPLHARQ